MGLVGMVVSGCSFLFMGLWQAWISFAEKPSTLPSSSSAPSRSLITNAGFLWREAAWLSSSSSSRLSTSFSSFYFTFRGLMQALKAAFISKGCLLHMRGDGDYVIKCDADSMALMREGTVDHQLRTLSTMKCIAERNVEPRTPAKLTRKREDCHYDQLLCGGRLFNAYIKSSIAPDRHRPLNIILLLHSFALESAPVLTSPLHSAATRALLFNKLHLQGGQHYLLLYDKPNQAFPMLPSIAASLEDQGEEIESSLATEACAV
ncbi:hypothetical protein GOP47_0000393 [Adiantum capillus-veneris]|uniref:Uncharacterized protein n=1 Tax=Adiantum capillus-veneris TaxID=13818 RepID=A0A9D4VD85_ADICA|nr:hypothetical protein GOP47_0000393 [Adiantum capillus-veneris]